MVILETARLVLREFELTDANDMYLLNSDREVIRFTGDIAFKNVAEAESFLRNYDSYKKYGCGRWAVIRKDDNAFLGWCGLKYSPGKNETDIGFRFFKKYWNQGYATESAGACLDYGFSKLGLETIVGRAMKKNLASVKVLEKIGLEFDHTFDFDGSPGVIYKITVHTK